MKRALPLLFLVSMLATAGISRGSRIDPNRPYPRFQLGVTGVHATVEKGLVVTVESVEAGSPADGKLSKGDVILTAGGRALGGEDLRIPLGEALGEAEAKDGRLVLAVRRDGKRQDVAIGVPVLGPYAKTWPLDCQKSKTIVRQTAEFLCKAQQEDGTYKVGNRSERDGLSGCLMGLFLLSTGDDRYLANVRLQARKLAEVSSERPSGSTWHLGYQGLLLAEYYLRSGDRSVLAGLNAICRQAAQSQRAGAWGHGAGVNPGYVQSGLMNSAGVSLFAALALARECGVTVSEEAFLRSLRFFYRMAGHGCICYGDHRSELFPNTNGRNATIACGMSLLDGKPYQMAARHLALIVSDSYYAHEFGHTGGGFNVIWRGMGSVHALPEGRKGYRRQMDKLAWYYDLCRLPGGGFSMLPSPPSTTRYCGPAWGTGAIGLTYTAPLKTLRITGAPRSKFSVKARPLPELPWGSAADLAFLGTGFCEGYGEDDVEPHEIHVQLRTRQGDPSVEYCAKMMRHYSPMVRTWAARKLADKADEASVAAIVAGLSHPDPRVRRAACDGISGYDNWGRPTSPGRLRGKIPPAVVSARCIPPIEKILKDPEAAWWEIDGALWALGRAEADDIRRNMALIRKAAEHEEWYVREAAFWAIVGLRKSITGPEFLLLADMYAKARHVFVRSSFDMGFKFLISGEKIELGAESEGTAVRRLGPTAHSALIVEDYGTGGKHEATHRTMMVLKHFDDPALYGLIVDDLVKYLEDWTPDYQHSAWLITGSPWQLGLAKVAEDLGKDAKPLIAAFKKCLARIDKDSTNKSHVACRESLRKAIADYEKKFGK